MAEEIRRSDVGQEDLFKDIKESADNARKALQKFDKEVVELSNDIEKKLHKSNKKTLSGINNLTQAQKKASKTFEREVKTKKQLSAIDEAKLKLDKKLKKEKAALNIANSKEAKELAKLRAEKNKINKATRDEIKQAERNKNAYTKLSDESRDLKNESKRLGAELLQLEANGGKNTKEFRKLEKQYEDTTQQARKTDAQLKDLDKTVGDNFRNVGNYESATDKLTGSLKNLAGAAGIGAAVTGFANFARQASKAENQARTFFDTNEEGTKEIAKQANITAKVYDKEVNEVLKSANALSKQFGLTGQESMAMLNKGFEKGGDVSGELLQNVQEYSTQLRLAGLNAEQSLSIITQSQQQGVFSDKGIDSIKEATLSLREMTPPAKEALEAIGMSAEQVQKDIASGSKSYFDVIQEVSSKTKEVGENSQEAGMILADIFKGAGEDAGDFILQLGDMNTGLDQMEDQNQGLDGAVKNLTRSWNEFLYGVKEGTGAMDAFSGVINFVADNLGAILGTLTRVGAMFLIYQSRAKIAAASNFLFNGGLKKIITSIPRMVRGIKTASFSFKTLGRAMKSIPFVAIVAGLVELISYLWDTTDATDANTESEKELNDELERGNELRAERASIGASIDEQVEKRNELSQAQLKITKRQIEADLEAAEANDLKLQKARDLGKMGSEINEQEQKRINQIEERLNSEEQIGNIERTNLEIELERLKGIIGAEATRISLKTEGLKLSDDERETIEKRRKQLSLILPLIKDDVRTSKTKTESLKNQNKELQKQRINLKEIDDLLNEGRSLGEIEDEEISQENDAIERELDQRMTIINDHERNRTWTEKEAQDQRELMELEALLEKKKILETYGRDTTEIDRQISEKRLQISKESKNKELEVEKEKGGELLKTATELQEALTDVYVDSVDRRIEKLQEEQDAAKAQQDYLQELASSGQIDAQQSILATQRQQEELEREQRKLEKRKAQIQLISGGLTSYANAIEQGKSPAEALTSTIANTQLLVNGLKSIQAFKSGSEDVGNGGKMDEHGGFLAMLHPKERVMTAEQNAKVSGIPNPLLAEIGHKFKSGELTEKGGQVGYDMGAVVNRLESLENTIKNKPEHYVNFESIAGKMYLNHTKKAGKTIINNKYKVN